eukprot:CAMPEP_0174343212 /NCGR_PEP_ID=MMETSP0810-20121108/26772_1 /TAXON_ID=73025 ORGANISM="Eutreptiella gymnastica-like, Strain CCMP1594" /NCGR_SAMPLE_ID=MMETSP0810 /ASSEMBLY_ACC=CAM_ASM_000659 /LENGTH=58 /DNA_ID=CAMNT_0015465795 /DNA_START=179 /DNA_END=353 /DNA_ORIENTATION=-
MTCDRAWAEADFVQKQGPSCYKLALLAPHPLAPGYAATHLAQNLTCLHAVLSPQPQVW